MKPRDLGEVIAKVERRQAAEAVITEAVQEYGFTEAEVAEMLAEQNDPPAEWTPIDFRCWPDLKAGEWANTPAAVAQRIGERRILAAQDAADEAAEEA